MLALMIEEKPHDELGHRLIGQTWDLQLRPTGRGSHATAAAAARPAARPEKRQPPRKVPSRER